MTSPISLLNKIEDSTKIYRYMEAEHLAEWFDTKKIRLARPDTWDDPFEKFIWDSIFPRKPRENLKTGEIFGLCFSTNGASDALWRIYSPKKNGLRICTTVGKLRAQFSDLDKKRTFIGRVNYSDGQEIEKMAKKIQEQTNEKLRMESIAKAMMEKRRPFNYEEEVRVITFLPEAATKKEKHYFTPLDPRTLVTRILFDPRTSIYTEKIYKNYFSSLIDRKKTKILKSKIYENPKHDPMP